jgi:hypothetical protein
VGIHHIEADIGFDSGSSTVLFCESALLYMVIIFHDCVIFFLLYSFHIKDRASTLGHTLNENFDHHF